MALSTGAKVAIGIAGAAALAGVVVATRKPTPKKKGKNGKGGGGSTRPKPTPSGCPPTKKFAGYDAQGNPICLELGGIAPTPAEPIPGDQAVMDQYPAGNAGHTSFFTQQSEQMIRSDLVAWRNANPAADCEPVLKLEFDGIGEPISSFDYFPAAREGTVAVLSERYPTGGTGKTIEWAGALDNNQQWIRWLFMRVERIAWWEVCKFRPV